MNSRSGGGKRRLRLAVGVLLGLALLAAAVVFFVRDQPRRIVQRQLGERLGAEVRLGGFSILGTRRFVLQDLEVRQMAGRPELVRLLATEVEVEGSPGDILRGKIDLVRLADVEVRLSPLAAAAAGPEAAPPVEVEIGSVVLDGVHVVVAAGGGEATIKVEGRVRDFARRPSGELVAGAEHLPLSPLVAFFRASPPADEGSGPADLAGTLDGDIEGFEATLTLAPGGSEARLEAHAREIRLPRGQETVSVLGPVVEALVKLGEGDAPAHVTALAKLPFADHVSLDAEVDPVGRRLLRGRALARGLDLGAVARLAFAIPPGAVLDGVGALEVEREPDGRVQGTVTADLEALTWPLGEDSIEMRGVKARLDATALPGDGKGGTPVTATLALDLDRTAGVEDEPWDLLFPVRGDVEGRIESASTRRFEGRLRLSCGTMGGVTAIGSAALASAEPSLALAWSWAGANVETLLSLAGELGVEAPGGVEVEGRIAASGTLSGLARSPRLEVRLRLEGAKARPRSGTEGEASSWEIRGGSAEAVVAWAGRGSEVRVRSLEGAAEVSASPLAPRTARATAEGTLDIGTRQVAVDRARLELPGLGNVTASGTVEPGREPLATVNARVDGVAAGPLWNSLRPILGDVLPGFDVKGTLRSDLDAKVHGDWSFTAAGKAESAGTGLSSDAGDKVIEGFEAKWDLTATGSLSPLVASVKAKASVGGFQLLWGSLFADYSALPSDLRVEATVAPSFGARASWSWPEGPKVEASLAAVPDGSRAWSLVLDVADLRGMVSRYLRGPLGDSVPFFEKIEGGGAARARLEGTLAGEGRTLAGRIRLEDLAILGTKGFADLRGLDLDLPLDLRWEGGRLRGPRSTGSLTFEGASVGGFEFQAVSTLLAVEGDTVELERALSVPLLGGTVRLERARLAEILSTERRLESAVALEGLKLEPLSEMIGLPRLTGALDGRFPEVSMTGEAFEARGGGEVAAFGGRIRVGDVSGRDVLSRYPKLRFSADFEDVDLGQVTRTFDFGEMTGIVRGHVRDLELFRGTPVRFEARIESVPRKGVPQKVTVKAINNLTILGTGGSPGILDRGIRRFLKHYTYKQLGIEMYLDNDAFLLKGLARRGDRELFLEGGFPFPIDIVNADPGRTVSFSSMLERIQGLDFQGVSMKRGGGPK